jgi:signal transduction histidine kinase
MRLGSYLADRKASLLLAVLVIFVSVSSMRVFGMDDSAALFVICLMASGLVIDTAYDFARRRGFYNQLQDTLVDLDKRHLVSELIERPGFLDGSIAYDAIKAAGKSMNDEIAGYRRGSEEYRDYIEAWVHEVKTPIATAELMVDNNRNEVDRALDGQLRRIESCVEQALYYSRSTAVEQDYLIRSVDLAELARKAVREHARALIDSGIQPVFGRLDITVFADPKWCSFVLGQIIDNAAKYRKPEGCSVLKFDALVADTGTADERVILAVADNGIGVSTGDVPRVFDKGFTGESGRRYGRSTGIGLYLCKRLCDKMGLSIGFESVEGEGSTVFVGFPRNAMYLP